MTSLERLKMEIRGINYPETDLVIYLAENGLVGSEEYNPRSNLSKKKIHQ